MSEGIAGALALLVEGVIFFCLQEPETVERMGKIGKYLTELLTGWAILMSTASVALLFIPLLFPNKFAPAWCIWVGAAICFLAANFIVWNRQYEKAKNSDAQLTDLNSRAIKILGVMEPQVNQYTLTVSGLEYRIDVFNASMKHSARNAEAKLIKIEPDVSGLRLPVWLEQMHDRATPKTTNFHLNPQDHQYIDVVLTRTDLDGMYICHTVSGVQAVIPHGRYVFTISVTADDMSGDVKELEVWDTDGTLHCETLPQNTGSIPSSHV